MTGRCININCFVPGCPNTIITAPQKLYFNVPEGESRRQWCIAAGRSLLSSKSTAYCCEDHFDVENDIQDWMRFKILKEAGAKTFKLKVKKGVVPHIFDCQPHRTEAHTKTESPRSAKRRRLSLVQDALQAASAATPSAQPTKRRNSSASELTFDTTKCLSPGYDFSFSSRLSDDYEASPTEPIETTLTGDTSSSTIVLQPPEPKFKDAYTQTSPETADKKIQAKVKLKKKPVRSIKTQTEAPKIAPPVPKIIRTCVCQFKKRSFKRGETSESDFSDSSATVNPPLSDLSIVEEELNSSFCSTASLEEVKKKYNAELLRKLNMTVMEENPLLLLGVRKEAFKIVHLLEQYSGCCKENIFLIFRKLRRNETFDYLSLIFSRHKSTLLESFKEWIPVISGYLKRFIYWPPRDVIQSNVPLAFRARYSKVESLIDCFEIEIEKLSNPVHQALTWSEYKNCNTAKILISCTPDGLISYVSKAYGGRATDVQIVKESEYLDQLAPSAQVMADRGFKLLEEVLVEHNCSLLRPPSVSADKEMTKQEARETKIIASLRIHVERVINRIRDYAFLGPHACAHHDLLRFIDYAVIITSALCNVQPPIVHEHF